MLYAKQLGKYPTGCQTGVMPINVANLTDDQLKNLVENHRRHKATSAPTYLEALRELQI